MIAVFGQRDQTPRNIIQLDSINRLTQQYRPPRYRQIQKLTFYRLNVRSIFIIIIINQFHGRNIYPIILPQRIYIHTQCKMREHQWIIRYIENIAQNIGESYIAYILFIRFGNR